MNTVGNIAGPLLAYVVLDGYDLGVGMLLPRGQDSAQKDAMVASIGPFWDANEAWLVLGVGVLLVAFPLAHGEILGALYLPVALMLLPIPAMTVVLPMIIGYTVFAYRVFSGKSTALRY